MDSQTKRTITATLACILVLFAWLKLQEMWNPPLPPQAATEPAETATSLPGEESSLTAAPTSSSGPANAAASGDYAATSIEAGAPVVLGDDRQDDKRSGFHNPYEFAVTVTPREASIETIRLSRHRNHVSHDKRNPDHDPFDLVQVIEDSEKGRWYASFSVEKILMVDDKKSVDLSGVNWSIEKTGDDQGQSAILRTTIRKSGQPVLALTKTYRVGKGSYHLEGSLSVENLSTQPQRVVLTQRGPIGFKNEDPQRESRRLASILVSFDADESGKPRWDAKGQPILTYSNGDHPFRADIVKEEGLSKELRRADKHYLWTALGNKYFGCIVTWLPQEGGKHLYAEYLAKVVGRAYVDDPQFGADLNRLSDLSFEEALGPPAPIAPGKSSVMRFEAFCGPKSDQLFAQMPPAIQQRQYSRIRNVDLSGTCTWEFITTALLWLLRSLHRVVGNYGIAIIILVFIVRLILHPVTKSGQVRMMRTQKGIAAIQPKLRAIQEQYKNDKQKLNEETMKLYREEGINPASSIFGCLPMALQLPIWAGLWSSLNTNVDLRHQPFFWWIHDLSIPDGLITPATPWNLNLPLINMMSGPINTFNLLPIIMAITMYGQQKFMQKLTKPATPPPPKLDAEGRPLPDQMAQQQKIMNFMMIFFGLMLYNVPAGLNLYILCSSLLGMLEQYRIKMHIQEKEERGDFTPPSKQSGSRRPSFFGRLQKRAESLRQTHAAGESKKPRKQKKQPRF